MLLWLQITLTILSAICVALVLPLGVWLGFTPAIALALAAVMFFMLMKLCKQTREFREKTDEPKCEQQTESDENPQN
ncbi:MAG: hypothetical protein J6B56_05100 [Clostridia bacterium]|nr:hypothetical protein [Clostridia bacterium]